VSENAGCQWTMLSECKAHDWKVREQPAEDYQNGIQGQNAAPLCSDDFTPLCVSIVE
jgi:hypothetical protein